MKNTRKILILALVVLAAASLLTATAFAEGPTQTECPDCAGTGVVETACETCGGTGVIEEESNPIVGTIWSLLPPVIAILLALITKEVYSSLFIGVVVGALLYSRFNIVRAVDTIVNDGMIIKLADSWDVGILIFLVILGIMVCMMNKAGGSYAFGAWAEKHVRTRVGAQLATFALGVLIFVDDYFNCLTVGSVMLPVSDGHRVSRAKLAYIIDATAAPICMIAPISSWAAAVSGVVEGTNGLTLFIRAIPYNFYSLLTIVMVIALTLMKFDFGPMAKHERNAKAGDLFSGRYASGEVQEQDVSGKGKIVDLVLPVAVLIAFCIIGMIYTGGFFSGTDFITAFSDCDASAGLSWGSLIALVITVIYFLIRRTVSFKDLMACVPKGFCAMVPAILILSLAWTLGGITGLLEADVYVAAVTDGAAKNLSALLPAIIFLVALGLAFATGTSWGTFGILIPIVTKVFASDPQLMMIGISACLAGAVCGDHSSPISDTTIMASAGAQCDHVSHVSTQLPYALTVAAVSFVCYILTAVLSRSWLIVLPIGIILLLGTLFVIRAVGSRRNAG